MQHAPTQETSQNIEMSLRDHLLAAGSAGQAPPPYPPSSVPPPPGPDQQHQHPYPTTDSNNQHHDQHHDHQHLDPNVTGGPLPYAMSGESATDEGGSPEIRKGKRELSTSKRAAQNRAAQRAFRQRKEGYIKKLEEQVKEFESMEQSYKGLQTENFQLREYILNLQSRLLENQSDFPPAPSHINLASGGGSGAPANNAVDSSYGTADRRELERQPPSTVTAREDPPRHDGMSQLHAAAAAQAGDNRHSASPYGIGNDFPNKRPRPDDGGSGDAKPQ